MLRRVGWRSEPAFIEAHLSESLASFVERNIHFAILMVEVDRMDHFVMTLGRGVVPMILRVVAQAVENSLRPEDLMGAGPQTGFWLC